MDPKFRGESWPHCPPWILAQLSYQITNNISTSYTVIYIGIYIIEAYCIIVGLQFVPAKNK